MGSFGDRLRKEREQRGISLDDIALATKIRAGLLQALEEEKFERLPGGIFNKGFVRAYARHLGIDEEQAITDYLAASGEMPARRPVDAGAPSKTEIAEPRIQLVKEEREEPESSSFSPNALLAGLLVLVMVGAAAWFYYHREKRVEDSLASTPQGVATQGTRGVTSGPAAAVEEPKSAANAPPSAGERSPASNASEQSTLPAGAAAAGNVPTNGFTVRIKADEDCWMQITIDGKMEEVTLTAQTEKVVSAEHTVVVRAGSVGALDISFNGKRVPPQGEYGQVKTLTFGPEGLVVPKPVVTPPTN